ncbi:MAG: FHA domain-containing protein [Dehalococcoidia bacterium]|nr:FHA domain-containing protein [Dehalococcoidia bacterium]
MSDTPRLERLLEQTVRLLSGGGLHPVEILQRTQAAVQAAARDGNAPNHVRIVLNPSDYARYREAMADLRYELDVLLDRLERREGWSRIGDRLIDFEQDPAAPQGIPAVTATFADTLHRDYAPPVGETQVIHRYQGLLLRLGDGTTVPFTHTPFRIGRGPGNDFLYPNLALSRNHAEIATVPGGLEIRDLGSRNGVYVDGRRVTRTPLLLGQPVRLGDIELWLERER